MKIEFHPDFNFHIDLKVIWPRFKGLFKNFSFRPESYPWLMRKAALALSWILALLLVVVFLFFIVRASR